MIAMYVLDLSVFLLIPAGLAVAFMVWVLWKFEQDYRKRYSPSDRKHSVRRMRLL
jgi:hypothetical protein